MSSNESRDRLCHLRLCSDNCIYYFTMLSLYATIMLLSQSFVFALQILLGNLDPKKIAIALTTSIAIIVPKKLQTDAIPRL